MRDPKRIREFCNQLAREWRKVPDWRFGQLILNVLGDIQAQTGKDLFFMEDDEMMEAIQEYFNRPNSSPFKKQ